MKRLVVLTIGAVQDGTLLGPRCSGQPHPPLTSSRMHGHRRRWVDGRASRRPTTNALDVVALGGLYSSIRPAITGSNTLTVRQWLSTQSFDAQAAFGSQAIENVGAGRW